MIRTIKALMGQMRTDWATWREEMRLVRNPPTTIQDEPNTELVQTLIPSSMLRAMEKRVKVRGIVTSEYIRDLIKKDLQA